MERWAGALCVLSGMLGVACGARSQLDDQPPNDAAVGLDATTHDATSDALADAKGDANIDANANLDATIDAVADATVDAPVLVSDAGVVAVAVGGFASCVLLSDDSVRCWGDNTYGELGDGTTTSSSIPVTPFVGATALVALSGAVTCALLASNALWCWGFGGRVGDGTSVQRDIPVEVIDAGVAYVSGGGSATCAVLQTGAAQCWGYNGEGVLGDGTKTDRTAPVNVLSLGGAVTKIATGSYQTCAILSTGTTQCWGENFDGQLGDGTTADHLAPANVASLGAATSVATGEAQVCALLADGSVRCWGDGASGQLGNGKLTIVNETPTQVTLGDSATSLACGDQFCCVTLAAGTIRCWGDNTYGQLGDGTTVQRSSPVAVTSLADLAVSVSAQSQSTCALLASGSVQCWGALHDGTSSTTPVTISL